MKQNHCPLSQNLRMAAAALTATSIMASKVFRPVIRAGVAAAVILAALIAAVVTGKKIADRRRSPWEKLTGNLRRMRPVRKTKWSIRFYHSCFVSLTIPFTL